MTDYPKLNAVEFIDLGPVEVHSVVLHELKKQGWTQELIMNEIKIHGLEGLYNWYQKIKTDVSEPLDKRTPTSASPAPPTEKDHLK